MSTETSVPASEASSGNLASGAPAAEVAQVEQNGAPEPAEDGVEHIDDTPFPVTVVLPHDNQSFELPVSPLEQINEIRQSIMEHPIALQYSCFRLEHNGERVNEYTQVSDVKGLGAGSELHLVEEPYTEKEARIHVIRIRELIGAAGNRPDTVQGVLAGASIYDYVTVDEPKEGAETSKEVPEYKFDAEPALTTLIPKETEAAPKAVKSIALSSWNPPPAPLRQKGHLLYLVVATNEGEQWQITAHVGGFFVNKCSNAKFDPFRNTTTRGYAEHSLFTLLQKISPSFATTFAEYQEVANRRDPLATFQVGNAIPSAPWLVPSTESPTCHHSADPARPQETYLLAGADNTDSLRDWNEEFQSARELPRESIQDRLFRERLISKLFADYNDAAARGAVLVARGEVTPLNPTEGPDAQIFVYNNVFFSFGADGVGTFTSEGGDDAARVATGKDVLGVKLVNQLDIEGLYTPGTVVVDYLGKRIVGQSIVPGIFKQPEPGENQINYGAVDGKEHVAADERFVSAFEKLATQLRVKKHAVWDKDHKRFDLEASVEMKGLMGTDGRKYVLDLYRITPLDIAWMEETGEDSEQSKYPHRMTVLRPELVEMLGKQKAREFINAELARRAEAAKGKKAAEGSTEQDSKPEDAEKADKAEDKGDKKEEDKTEEEKLDRIDMANFKFALNPDVFSGQVPQTDEEKAEMAKDEQDVRDACTYLRDVIKTLIKDLRESDISFPMDGRSLTKLLHRRGINMRYLGLLAKLGEKEGSRLECFRHLCVQEMISRSFKHIAARYLRYLPLPLTSACFSHLLNCLLGFGLNPKPVAEIDETLKALYNDADLSFEEVTPENLRKDIEREAAQRFRYTLAENWWAQIRHTQLLREVAMKLGLQIQVKNFVFTGEPEAPAAKEQAAAESRKSKKKKARDGSPASIASSSTVPHTFSPDDIVNVVPLVKDSAPRSALAEEALEGGRLSIYQGQRKLGEDLLLESLSLHEQIYGLVHPEVAQMYHTLSQMYYQLDQKEAAVELARKAAIVSERTVGLDAAETVLNYLNLSLFLHQGGDSQLALAYAKHALDVWKIIYGPDHPDTITTMNNYAVMLQSIKAYHESRRWFEESLRVCEMVFGRKSVNSATLLFQLAQALALDQDAKQAVDRMRESYNIFKDILGPEDKNTKEAEHWLEQLLHNAVSIAKQAKDQARNARNGFPFATRGLGLRGATNAANDIAGKPPAPMTDSRSLDELVHFIEGTDKKKTSSGGKKRTGRANPKRRGSAAVCS
ncbi:clustered mitochondria-domain-containing protein [Podospora aff. communis PSN243]|uniref:Clustered mitochondria protein homolog n=1 Tax=Podospora aff. communis PSN243 TaxID=3040156 RepID=A0AAV9H5P2_9PEZI|nr:clustered mitochondria-domain-containing protein [Podospora aff. communis PSN243]